jgi:hypothetical protein
MWYSFSNLQSPPVNPHYGCMRAPHSCCLIQLGPHKNAVFQGAAHGTGSDVAMLLHLSFAGGDKDGSGSDESDGGDIRTNDMKEHS